MGLRINTNVGAISTSRHLFNSTVKFGKSMEKLSSGFRINRAADDAAGLAVSEGLKSDVRALDQAARNAGDGIGLVQTAEGYLDEVSAIMIRMRELAMQSRNGTLTDQDRSYLSEEFYAMRDEINRIGWSAEFNGVKLLDGTGGTVSIQVGTSNGANDRIDIDLSNDIDNNALPLTAGIWDRGLAATAMAELDNAMRFIVGLRGDFGAIQNRLETTVRNIQNTSENLTAANSRVRDVDVASETSTMTSFQILQQAGVSMLSQANMTTGLALSLMTG